MDSDLLEAGADPALELCFSSEWQQEAEPDPSTWDVGDRAAAKDSFFDHAGELVDGESAWSEYGVPLGEDEDAVATCVWNLGPSLRRDAAAAAFVPLLSIAGP